MCLPQAGGGAEREFRNCLSNASGVAEDRDLLSLFRSRGLCRKSKSLECVTHTGRHITCCTRRVKKRVPDLSEADKGKTK